MRSQQRVALTSVFLAVTLTTHGGQVPAVQPSSEAAEVLEVQQINPPQELFAEMSLDVAELPEYGAYLTDGQGRALYILDADGPNSSACYDVCAAAWPPFGAPGEGPEIKSPEIREDLIESFERFPGTTQLSYNEMPLYYYIKDAGPGSVHGQAVQDPWGKWFLVSPDGEPILNQGAGESGG